MRITLESDYALRILTVMAEYGDIRDAKTISTDTSVTIRFTLKILHKLVGADLVESFKGIHGGYKLKKSPDEITLKEKQLLSDNLDYLALYLRKESDRLTPEDIDKLEPIVNDLYRIASKLKNSGSFAKENRLSSSSYIKFMIDQRTTKNEKK